MNDRPESDSNDLQLKESSDITNTSEADTAISKDERNWALFAHIAAFGAFVVPVAGSIVGPLIIWTLKKDEMPFLDFHGRESLNFQISMMIYMVISFILCIVLIGFFFLWLVPVIDFIFVVIAAIKASDGQYYRYPFTIRFL